jgi:hypothetical protein
MPPRPLHYQQAASREIVVVEKMDLHLVWEPNRIYLKPLPRYLLSHSFWRDHLVCKPGCCCTHPAAGSGTDASNKAPSLTEKPYPLSSSPLNSKQQSIGRIDEKLCSEHQLHQCAFGFLLSYVALIQIRKRLSYCTIGLPAPRERILGNVERARTAVVDQEGPWNTSA